VPSSLPRTYFGSKSKKAGKKVVRLLVKVWKRMIALGKVCIELKKEVKSMLQKKSLQLLEQSAKNYLELWFCPYRKGDFLSDALFLIASDLISGFFSAIKGRRARSEIRSIADALLSSNAPTHPSAIFKKCLNLKTQKGEDRLKVDAKVMCVIELILNRRNLCSKLISNI